MCVVTIENTVKFVGDINYIIDTILHSDYCKLSFEHFGCLIVFDSDTCSVKVGNSTYVFTNNNIIYTTNNNIHLRNDKIKIIICDNAIKLQGV